MLSDKEIKYLIKEAESYQDLVRKTDGDDTTYLEQALTCYNQIIENAPLHPHYLSERAKIKRMLAHRSSIVHLDEAIKDINRAIELDPDKGEYYLIHGIFLSEKLMMAEELYRRRPYDKNISNADKKQLLGKIIADYKASIERDPSNPQAWLNLLEINIFLHKWDDTISIYGSCKPYLNNKEDRLIRSWLGCLALAFAGEPMEEEDKKVLYDRTIQIKLDTRVMKISSFLNEMRRKEGYKDKWEKANEIHELFIDHFYRWIDKGIIFYHLNSLEKALEAFDKAIKINPEYAMAYFNKGSILMYLGYYEGALEALDKAIEIEPNYASAWYSKACTYSLKSDKINALIFLSRALDLDAKFKEYAKQDNYFRNLWADEDFKRVVM